MRRAVAGGGLDARRAAQQGGAKGRQEHEDAVGAAKVAPSPSHPGDYRSDTAFLDHASQAQANLRPPAI